MSIFTKVEETHSEGAVNALLKYLRCCIFNRGLIMRKKNIAYSLFFIGYLLLTMPSVMAQMHSKQTDPLSSLDAPSPTVQIDTSKLPTFDKYVVDEVGLFSPMTHNELNRILAEHEKTTNDQIMIAAVYDLADETIVNYADALLSYWKMNKNNVLLLLIAPYEREIHLEMGHKFKANLTDAIIHSIIFYRLEPAFENKQFNKSIIPAVEDIISAVQGQYRGKIHQKIDKTRMWVIYVIFLIGNLIILVFMQHKVITIAFVLNIFYMPVAIISFDTDLPWVGHLPIELVVFLGFFLLIPFGYWISTWKFWEETAGSGGSGGYSGGSSYSGGSDWGGGGGSSGGGGASGSW